MKYMNKTVIITGGGSGIGLATAEKFAQNNYNIVIAGRNEEKLKKASSNLKDKFTTIKIEYKKCDVSNISDVRELFNFTKKKFTQIDCLINSAAIIDNKPFIKLDINKLTNPNYYSQLEVIE